MRKPDSFHVQVRLAGVFLTLAVLAASGGASQAHAAVGSGLRDQEGLTLTGSQIPALLGAAPEQVVAYRYDRGRWGRVAVQVDQRKLIDLSTLYGPQAAAYAGARAEVYADPATYAGADPDPAVDADDEISFLASTAGQLAPAPAPARLGTHFSAVTLRGGARHDRVYLGIAAQPQASPRDGVTLTLRLKSGSYPASYRILEGPNPEDTTLKTPFYRRHFADRWLTDGMIDRTGRSRAVNVLEREMFQFAPGNCDRSEDTFDQGEGAIAASISGPVRAIRSIIGANSGPLTQRTSIFWPHYEQDITDVRVHAIPSVMDFFALHSGLKGMRYRTSSNPSGAAIDGRPDSRMGPGAFSWAQLIGPQGSIEFVTRMRTTLGIGFALWWNDDMRPAAAECTGDHRAFGDAGTFISEQIGSTDPRVAPAATLVTSRTLFYDPPGTSVAVARARSAQVDHPLSATVAQ